jgi:NitT/TauT family transport system substrate-binding protein/putative hydroxymethylpyrimidine transport system substrate-binding protein
VRRPPAALAALGALVIAAAGCGGGGAGGVPTVVVGLDFTPNAVHAPIFEAARAHLDRRAGVRLRIRTPGSGPDTLKLIAAGRIDMGVLDIHDLGIARQRGLDLVGIAALVQRPLAALIAQPAIHRPRELEGHVVGVSGLPSDPAFVRAVMQHDGGDFARARQVTIGFAAVSSLLTHRVDAVPAFWNAEGVALRERGVPVREFRVDDYGAPGYPEVVLITTRRTLRRRRADIVAALRAIRDGEREALAHPDTAARTVARAAGTNDVRLVRAQLAAVASAVSPPLRLNRAVLERWATFDARIGILRHRPDVARAFDFGVAPR